MRVDWLAIDVRLHASQPPVALLSLSAPYFPYPFILNALLRLSFHKDRPIFTTPAASGKLHSLKQ